MTKAIYLRSKKIIPSNDGSPDYWVYILRDASFGEFKTMLTYKCNWYGSNLLTINRFAPSSKTCSKCSNVKSELKLSERIYHCDCCGHTQDRDLNAAINIKNMAVSSTVSCYEVHEGSFTKAKVSVGAVAIKQQML